MVNDTSMPDKSRPELVSIYQAIKKYPREAIIMRTERFDKTTGAPSLGRILFHSPNTREIWQRLDNLYQTNQPTSSLIILGKTSRVRNRPQNF